MAEIVLSTLNAKWIHASFGLRYLRANLGDLRERSEILEFDLQRRTADIVEVIPVPRRGSLASGSTFGTRNSLPISSLC